MTLASNAHGKELTQGANRNETSQARCLDWKWARRVLHGSQVQSQRRAITGDQPYTRFWPLTNEVRIQAGSARAGILNKLMRSMPTSDAGYRLRAVGAGRTETRTRMSTCHFMLAESQPIAVALAECRRALTAAGYAWKTILLSLLPWSLWWPKLC